MCHKARGASQGPDLAISGPCFFQRKNQDVNDLQNGASCRHPQPHSQDAILMNARASRRHIPVPEIPGEENRAAIAVRDGCLIVMHVFGLTISGSVEAAR